MYIKLIIEYEGTAFAGWQIQSSQRTVQGEIEKALQSLTGQHIRIIGAGRTDAGVHALGQVASFQEKGSLPVSAYRLGLNKFLPEDIRIVDAEKLDYRFDARRDAKRRLYRYVISKQKRVIGRNYAWYPQMQFDLNLMKEAAQYLIGEHDFKSFCKFQDGIDDTVSHVYDIKWDESDREVIFEITAVKYFHNMIRILIGTLMDVGTRKITPLDFKNILESKNRETAGKTVPPHGLFLIKVFYNP